MIPHILHDIQHLHSLPCNRAAPLRLLSAPGRPRLGSPDRQHLSGGSAQHATLTWPARPKGRLLPAGYRQKSRGHACSAKPRRGCAFLLQLLSWTGSELHWTAQPTPTKCSYGRWLAQPSLFFSGWVSCYLRAQPQSAQPRH